MFTVNKYFIVFREHFVFTVVLSVPRKGDVLMPLSTLDTDGHKILERCTKEEIMNFIRILRCKNKVKKSTF